jgi:hypothetical protein
MITYETSSYVRVIEFGIAFFILCNCFLMKVILKMDVTPAGKQTEAVLICKRNSITWRITCLCSCGV